MMFRDLLENTSETYNCGWEIFSTTCPVFLRKNPERTYLNVDYLVEYEAWEHLTHRIVYSYKQNFVRSWQ